MSIHPDFISSGLEDRYNLILNTRMIGVPAVNPEIRVEAVGFQPWQDCCLGVLITPWFMNLMLISCEGNRWQELPVGSVQTHEFPSGNYQFIVGHEEGIGFYQSCSLFSPMFEFKDHEDAQLVAQETLQLIMDTEIRETSCNTCSREIQRIWQEHEAPDAAPAQPKETSLSRRDLLRGAFLRDENQNP